MYRTIKFMLSSQMFNDDQHGWFDKISDHALNVN